MSVPRANSPSSRNGRNTNSRGNKSGSGGSGATSKVRVVGRIRPLARYEIRNGSQAVVTKVPGGSGDQSETLQIDNGNENNNHSNSTNRWFELDAILDETSTQKDVYEKSGARTAIAEDLFCGYNATILAYGQTGSGKTFTMGTAPSTSSDDQQNDETDGVIPRACQDLFDNVKTKCDGQAEVTCSYMEVYNEEIRDLLVDQQQQQQTQLRIRETLDGQIYVRGLKERTVTAPLDVYKIMEEANKRRGVASTKMNAASSRSHAICVLKIKGVVVVGGEASADDGISRTFEAKLTLVDLAGSERLKKTQAKGSRAKEGISINKGLFVLGQVVSALAEKGRILSEMGANEKPSKKKKQLLMQKPPYRDSKLTRLLQDSLGGNSRTIMIACVSPADFNVEETVNTLRYATQARNISNTTTANLVETISQSEARKLKRDNILLRKQIEELEETIQKLTQDVTEDDLERSMSFIQAELQDSITLGKLQDSMTLEKTRRRRGNGMRASASITDRDIHTADTGGGARGDDDDLNDTTTHVSNVSIDSIISKGSKKSNGNNNSMSLSDHFERSDRKRVSFGSEPSALDKYGIDQVKDFADDAEDKDSVSLLVDDIFENGSHSISLGQKWGNKRFNGNASVFSGVSSVTGGTSVNSQRTIEEVEEENADLSARLLLAEKDVRATAKDTAVELPKLKRRVKELEDDLNESKWLENETRELREQLSEARADKDSAQRAAQQLADFMDEQKIQTGFRGDEIRKERVDYSRHKLNEDWVRFVVVVLNSFKEEMRLLGDYFQMVVQVVDSPDILDMLGTLNNRERKQMANAGMGWWKSKEQKEKELGALSAEKELRNTLLREHISFFNDRLVEIEDEVNLRSESIDVVLESLANVRGQMESDFESEDEVASIRDLYSKKGEKLLSQLTELMAGKLYNTSQRPTIEVT